MARVSITALCKHFNPVGGECRLLYFLEETKGWYVNNMASLAELKGRFNDRPYFVCTAYDKRKPIDEPVAVNQKECSDYLPGTTKFVSNFELENES